MGLEERRKLPEEGLDKAAQKQREYAAYVERTTDAAENLTDRYAVAEESAGNAEHARMMKRVVRYGEYTAGGNAALPYFTFYPLGKRRLSLHCVTL